MRRWLCLLSVAACTPVPQTEGVPCEVADVVSAHCASCHAEPLLGGAPMTLASRGDFTAKSMLDANATFAQRSVTRMKASSLPMPPGHMPSMSASEVQTLEQWVSDGTKKGTCFPKREVVDAGSSELTCLSGTFMPQPMPTNPRKSPDMAPGDACNACHVGMNFQDQNPGGALGQRPDLAFDVAGTVYTSLHEKDLCVSLAGDAGAFVEIFDRNGALAIRTPVNEVGNFYENADGGLLKPFTARVVRGTSLRPMLAPQTVSDCNTCHTQSGAMDAPGRIRAPD